MTRSATRRLALHTERLVLRPLTFELAGALLQAGLPRAPDFPGADDQGLLERVAAVAGEAGPVYLVEHDGLAIGTCGAVGPPDDSGGQEIAYTLVPSARGGGVGTEAVGALCAVLERRPGTGHLLAQVRPDNTGSLRLLQRLGFVPAAGAADGYQLLVRGPEPAPRIRGRHVC